MILVDTSVWIDHFRSGSKRLAGLLTSNRVLAHPFVIGELALGHLRERALIVHSLQNLPLSLGATHSEVLDFIDRNALPGTGIGYVDAHLLASVRLTVGSALWTNDQRLAKVADRLGLAARAR